LTQESENEPSTTFDMEMVATGEAALSTNRESLEPFWIGVARADCIMDTMVDHASASRRSSTVSSSKRRSTKAAVAVSV
jgi:hypothetical protein